MSHLEGCKCQNIIDSNVHSNHVIKLISPPTPNYYKRINDESKINVPLADHQNGAFVLTHDGMSRYILFNE